MRSNSVHNLLVVIRSNQLPPSEGEREREEVCKTHVKAHMTLVLAHMTLEQTHMTLVQTHMTLAHVLREVVTHVATSCLMRFASLP